MSPFGSRIAIGNPVSLKIYGKRSMETEMRLTFVGMPPHCSGAHRLINYEHIFVF